jgi:hypothetical protein
MKKEISVTFEVAMDAEQKKLGNVEKVKFVLEFPEGCEDQVQSDAVAHQIVKFQQQIRSNWDSFIKDGVPERVTYGQPLYGRRTATRPPTQAEIEAVMMQKISQLTPEGLQVLASTGKMPEGEEYYK